MSSQASFSSSSPKNNSGNIPRMQPMDTPMAFPCRRNHSINSCVFKNSGIKSIHQISLDFIMPKLYQLQRLLTLVPATSRIKSGLFLEVNLVLNQSYYSQLNKPVAQNFYMSDLYSLSCDAIWLKENKASKN